MHEDMQYVQKDKIPSIKKIASKSEKYVQQEQLQQVHMSKESMVNNPEEIEEGPTLALLLIGNVGFKNMTYLNKKYKKNQHKETEISDSSDFSEEEVEVAEEKNKLIAQDANFSEYDKKNKDLEEIFFQTEVVQQENEMEELPIAAKSYSSVQNSQNIESRQQQNDKQSQNSPSNAFDKQQTIQSLKEYSQKFKNSTLLISKSEYRNSNPISIKSQLINRQSTNLASNLYVRNSSTVAQVQSNTQASPINHLQQQTTIAEDKPFQTSKNKKSSFSSKIKRPFFLIKSQVDLFDKFRQTKIKKARRLTTQHSNFKQKLIEIQLTLCMHRVSRILIPGLAINTSKTREIWKETNEIA